MQIWAGTSGYSYKEWRGSFYPEKMKPEAMLQFYAQRLPSVELNNTFYRMPRSSAVEAWADRVGADFRFALKASRRITHMARLEDCSDSLEYMLSVTAPLGERLGCWLFQLPPTMKRDDERLAAFLKELPTGLRAAFEFRHPSWFDDAVYSQLREHRAALVGGDLDEAHKNPPFEPTADWGYLRLRRSEYSDEDVRDWARRLVDSGVEQWYVYFKHEEQGPALARQLLEAHASLE